MSYHDEYPAARDRVPESFFFYDLETTSKEVNEARIMQFAGQRTDTDLRPIGDPYNVQLRLSDDVLPDPEAILVTGITPKQTSDGLTEADFLRVFHDDIAQPGTIFVGFNNLTYDDEIIRRANYRNFYDPYEWHWRDDRSHWDLVNVVRMARALRPEGIEWPFGEDGRPSNRLELLTELNGLEHDFAHDALSDVHATIAVGGLVKLLQPKMFNYLLSLRHKTAASSAIRTGRPFVHTSNRYSGDHLSTTIAAVVALPPDRDAAIVFDLRYGPGEFLDMTAEELAQAWYRRKDEEGPRLPVQTVRFNSSPAVAPLGVLREEDAERIGLSRAECLANFEVLSDNKRALRKSILAARRLLDNERQFAAEERDVDERLYDGFMKAGDQAKLELVRSARPDRLGSLAVRFEDDRLNELLPRYIARNYPETMTPAQRDAWDAMRRQKLLAGDADSKASQFFARIKDALERDDLTDKQRADLYELRQYGQDVLPKS